VLAAIGAIPPSEVGDADPDHVGSDVPAPASEITTAESPA
jgi:hypothetical protein